MNTTDLQELLGKRVQVRLRHTDPSTKPAAEGEVVGIHLYPTIIVQDSDGNQSTHSAELPITVLPPALPEPANGTVLLYTNDDGSRSALIRDDAEAERRRTLNEPADSRWFVTGARAPFSWRHLMSGTGRLTVLLPQPAIDVRLTAQLGQVDQ